MSIRIVPAKILDESRRREAAEFARTALETFYSNLTPTLARELIAAEFLVEGDELADALVALGAGDTPAGLVAGYPLPELGQRQRIAFHHLLSSLPGEDASGFVATARALAGQVPTISGEGFYLARIGVASDARGSGLADRLLADFLAAAGALDAVLHVHGDNARAIAFYRRHGFLVEDDRQTYRVMRRAAA